MSQTVQSEALRLSESVVNDYLTKEGPGGAEKALDDLMNTLSPTLGDLRRATILQYPAVAGAYAKTENYEESAIVMMKYRQHAELFNEKRLEAMRKITVPAQYYETDMAFVCQGRDDPDTMNDFVNLMLRGEPEVGSDFIYTGQTEEARAEEKKKFVHPQITDKKNRIARLHETIGTFKELQKAVTEADYHNASETLYQFMEFSADTIQGGHRTLASAAQKIRQVAMTFERAKVENFKAKALAACTECYEVQDFARHTDVTPGMENADTVKRLFGKIIYE